MNGVNRIVTRSSLVAQAAQFLRDMLSQGQWTGELPGERTLCVRLGVSRPTLRAALDQLRREGRISVTQGKPTQILHSRKPAAGARRQVVGLLTPVPFVAMPPFVMCWVDELREQLATAGCLLDLHVSQTCYSLRPARALEGLVRRAPSAAWVLYLSNETMQRWFSGFGLPSLIAGSCAPGVKLPSVDVDHRAACRHAAGQLITRGCARIALVLPSGGLAGDRESEAGFVEALRPGRSNNLGPLVLRHDGSVAGLCSELDSMLRSKPRIDGLIVARSGHALTALTHLTRRGVRVPEDVALISRDDDEFLNLTVPHITRYSSDPDLFARRVSRAATVLAQQGFIAPRAVRLLPRFVSGETVNVRRPIKRAPLAPEISPA